MTIATLKTHDSELRQHNGERVTVTGPLDPSKSTATHVQQVAEEHALSPSGWCRCGLLPQSGPTQHAAHVRRMQAEAFARAALNRHADIRAERLNGRDALTIATAAAYAALEMKENAS